MLQWYVKNDPYSVKVDTFTHLQTRILETEWVPDTSIVPKASLTNTMLITEDVGDIDFCNFISNYATMNITKLGYRHPKCKTPYKFVRNIKLKAHLISSASSGAWISNMSYVPRDVFTFMYLKKKVYADKKELNLKLDNFSSVIYKISKILSKNIKITLLHQW